jgi:hypothetical protein
MKNIMKQLLDALRSRVQQNLNIIHTNENEIRQVLTEPLSNDRSQKLANRFALSKKILQENKDNLQIQSMIVNFLSKYDQVPNFSDEFTAIRDYDQTQLFDQNQEVKNLNEDVSSESFDTQKNNYSAGSVKQITKTLANKGFDPLFALTTSGKLKFNKAHPLFYDDNFYQNLLDYHTQREEYEICSLLVRLDRKK